MRQQLARWRFSRAMRRLGHSPRWIVGDGSWSVTCRRCGTGRSGRGTSPAGLTATLRATDTCRGRTRRSR